MSENTTGEQNQEPQTTDAETTEGSQEQPKTSADHDEDKPETTDPQPKPDDKPAEAPDGDDEDDEADESEGSDELLKKLRRKNTENRKLRERAKTAEATVLRYGVASEKGLPLTWAARLQGETKDELLADADELLAAIGHKPLLNSQPNDGNARSSDPTPAEDLSELAKSLFTR